MSTKQVRVLVVGQTPPPLGGQAIMIERILQGSYPGVTLLHVRMEFSKELSDAGKFSFRKIVELLCVLWGIWRARFAGGAEILYYPPAGPNLIPVLRDMFLLGLSRHLFRRIVFHFHAGGLHEIYGRLPVPLRLLFRLSYFEPDAAIRIARSTPEDAAFIRAKREFIIPYGIPDEAGTASAKLENRKLHILFVGVLRENKGVRVLLQALGRLYTDGISFHAVLMGKWVSDAFRDEMLQLIGDLGIGSFVEFPGVLSGLAKTQRFHEANVMCFPSFFDSEAFAVSLIEGLSFGLPIVSTHWRGIPECVEDGVSGLLVAPQDVDAIAAALTSLALDTTMRRRLGENARYRYLQHFTVEKFYERIGNFFLAVADA